MLWALATLYVISKSPLTKLKEVISISPIHSIETHLLKMWHKLKDQKTSSILEFD
jgi:hypothetical protein